MPQGSILGPLFFVLFTNDLPLYVNSGNIQIDLYADDTTLSCSRDVGHLDELQGNLPSALKDVETWTGTNRLPGDMQVKFDYARIRNFYLFCYA